MLAAVARWIASSERSVVAPICAAAGTIGSIASNLNPASTPAATAGACPPRHRATRVTSTVASKLEARSGQRRSSWRSAAVSASIANQLDEGRGVQVCDRRATRHADARREALGRVHPRVPPLPARPGRDRADRPRADRSARCERSTRPPRNGLRMKVGRPCPEYGASVRSADALAGDVQRHDAVIIATAAVGRDDRTASNPQRRRSPTRAVLVHPRPCLRAC